MAKRQAFTLVEVLISVALLSIIMLALYKSLEMQRISNKKVHTFLDKTIESDRIVMVLYNDILHSNGIISEQKAKLGPICIEETSNSLYGLSAAKVCWLVAKNDDSLVRVEGNGYKLPTGGKIEVESDLVAKGVKIFSVTKTKTKVLVVLQFAGEKSYAFVVDGIEKPKIPKKKLPKKKLPKQNTSDKKPADKNSTQEMPPDRNGANSDMNNSVNTP